MPLKNPPPQFAVIGHPVAHSLSPLMQNAAFKNLKLSHRYTRIHVRPKQLEKFMRTKARLLKGFNITLPHKEKIISYLDRVDPKARQMGAVNTVVNRNGTLVGFNTDGEGFVKALGERKFNPRKKQITILGAGGSARSLTVALSLAGAKSITIANRTVSRARNLVRQLRPQLGKTKLGSCGLKGNFLEKSLAGSQLLINTTSIGLKEKTFSEFPWKNLPRSALVCDLLYNPLITPFLREAKKHGHPVMTGESMLVFQGALSFKLWTGRRPNTSLMLKVVRRALKI